MRILDRYILASIIRVFVLTLLIFAFLYILIDTTTNLDDLIERKVPIFLMIVYYLNNIRSSSSRQAQQPV
jgi:lipopolysaccharide export LptBFGC system permease protein LptF